MSLPVELLLGVYLGLLAGIVPALIAGVLGFLFRYVTGVSIPAFAVIVLAATVAGVNGGLMGLLDTNVTQEPRFIVAILIVLMLAIYAHSQGDRLGATLPRRFSLRALSHQTLSADVIQIVGGIGEVTIQPKGVTSMEGYPPLPTELQEEIAEQSWRFPADIPLGELESRLERRLVATYHLSDATVSITEQGTAHITAAPPVGELSRRVPPNYRAVSLVAKIPTGLARGDHVTITAPGVTAEGTVISAKSALGSYESTEQPNKPGRVPTTTGGDGRVTVAVQKSNSNKLLAHDRGQLLVHSRGTRREYELLSVLRQAGNRIRKIGIRTGSSLIEAGVGPSEIRDQYGVVVLAWRPAEPTRAIPGRRWDFAPTNTVAFDAGDELFAVGPQSALDRFDAIARGEPTE